LGKEEVERWWWKKRELREEAIYGQKRAEVKVKKKRQSGKLEVKISR
jgi:hypothetical protein